MKPILNHSPLLSPATANQAALAEPSFQSPHGSIGSSSSPSLVPQDSFEATNSDSAQAPSHGSRFVEDFRSEKAMSISDESILEARAERMGSYSAVSVGKAVFLGVQKLYNGTVATLSAAVGKLMALAQNGMGLVKKPVETNKEIPMLPPIVLEKPLDWPLEWTNQESTPLHFAGTDEKLSGLFSPASSGTSSLLSLKEPKLSVSSKFAGALNSLASAAHSAINLMKKPSSRGTYDWETDLPITLDKSSLYQTQAWASSVETLFDLAQESTSTTEASSPTKPSRPSFGASSMPFSPQSAKTQWRTPFYTPITF